jgi:hypothetical protein
MSKIRAACLVLCMAASVVAEQARSEGATLSLDVASLNVANQATLWLGVSNASATARLICLSSRASWVVPTSGQKSTFVGDGFSPHACESPASFMLVLAGQTLYLPWNQPKVLSSDPEAQRVIKVRVAYREGKDFRSEKAEDIEWTGTLAQLRKRGIAMMEGR